MKQALFFLVQFGLGLGLWAGSVGLIDQPQTFPWSVGLTPVVQEEAGGLAPGTSRIKTSVLWFNTFRQLGLDQEMTQRVDMEGLLGIVSAAWSPAPGWELRSQVQGWTLGGGVMDLFLSGFHGVLFLPNQGRNLVADGQYRDFLAGSFDLRSPAGGITQASVAVRGFSGPWSWTAWVKPAVPAAVDWGWSDRWGAGWGAGWGDRWPWEGFSLGLGFSGALVLVQPDHRFPGARPGPTVQGGFYATVDTPWGPRALVEGSCTAVPRSGPGYLSQGAGLLTSGFQFDLGPSWEAELSLTEEFLTWATMEVGFQVGLAWFP